MTEYTIKICFIQEFIFKATFLNFFNNNAPDNGTQNTYQIRAPDLYYEHQGNVI